MPSPGRLDQDSLRRALDHYREVAQPDAQFVERGWYRLVGQPGTGRRAFRTYATIGAVAVAACLLLIFVGSPFLGVGVRDESRLNQAEHVASGEVWHEHDAVRRSQQRSPGLARPMGAPRLPGESSRGFELQTVTPPRITPPSPVRTTTNLNGAAKPPSRKHTPSSVAKPTDEPHAAGSSGSRLDAERTALQSASAALAAGNAASAIGQLDRYFRRFPGGLLRDEATVLQLRTLCALGHADRAREIGRRFVADNPQSAYAAEARAPCRGNGSVSPVP